MTTVSSPFKPLSSHMHMTCMTCVMERCKVVVFTTSLRDSDGTLEGKLLQLNHIASPILTLLACLVRPDAVDNYI
jgi:hypothetical protein